MFISALSLWCLVRGSAIGAIPDRSPDGPAAEPGEMGQQTCATRALRAWPRACGQDAGAVGSSRWSMGGSTPRATDRRRSGATVDAAALFSAGTDHPDIVRRPRVNLTRTQRAYSNPATLAG